MYQNEYHIWIVYRIFYHLAKKGLPEEGCGRGGKKCCAPDVDRPGTAFVKKN